MCYGAGTIDELGDYQSYYFNATAENGTQGQVVWELPLGGSNETTYVPSALTLAPNYGSNVGVPLFYPGVGYEASSFYVNVFPDNGTIYLNGGPVDTANNATYPDGAGYYGPLTNWVLCYQFTGGYYYYSIGFVFGVQPAQNPSCQAVNLAFQAVPASTTSK